MTCTTLSMVYIGLGSFLLRVVLRESSIDVEERYVRALDVIQAMVNMVLGVTAVALDLRGSMDHAFPHVVVTLRGEVILWMLLTPLLSRWLDTGTTLVFLTPVSVPLLTLLATDAGRRSGGHAAD